MAANGDEHEVIDLTTSSPSSCTKNSSNLCAVQRRQLRSNKGGGVNNKTEDKENIEIVDLTSSSPESSSNKKKPAQTAKKPKRRRGRRGHKKTQNGIKKAEDEVQGIDPPAKNTIMPTGTSNDSNNSDEIQLVAETQGASALVHFPHAREQCTQFPFHDATSQTTMKKNQLHCDQCYCYICDIPAAQCTMWKNNKKKENKEPAHCNASSRSAQAQSKRDKVLQARQQQTNNN